MIYIANKKSKIENIIKKYGVGTDRIKDVTSASEDWRCRMLSPFYPHHHIPVPFSPFKASCLEGNDAATENWGKDWHIPTDIEMSELLDLCIWDFVEEENVKGWKITGPNGNHIFLPCAGRCDGRKKLEVGEIACYWFGYEWREFALSLDDYHVNFFSCHEGRTIRPVYE